MRRWLVIVTSTTVLMVAGCISVAPAASPTSPVRSLQIPTPSLAPPATPTDAPTSAPTDVPTSAPTDAPTDAPTATAAPSASVVPTLGPTSAPSSPVPVPSGLSPTEAILAALVPEAFRASCESEEPLEGALATIECVSEVEGNTVRVRYSQYAFIEDMQAAYNDRLSYLGITTPDQGSCADTWPAEGSYTIEGATAGRVACAVVSAFPAGDVESIAWTNDGLRVEALAQGYSDITTEMMYGFWEGAGPIPDGTGPPPEPTEGPSGSDAPFPTAEEVALLGHIPASFSDACGRYTLGRPEPALAAIECPVELDAGSMTVTYLQWPSAEDMNEGYTRNLEFIGITRDSGPCSGTWPAEGPYTIGGESAGRVGCGLLGGFAPMIAWTDDVLLISVLAEGFSAEQTAMYEWWLGDSGPVR